MATDRWWQRVLLLGAKPTLSRCARRKLIQLNAAQFILMLVVSVYNCVFMLMGNPALILSGLLQVPFMVVSSLTWWLNHRGHLAAARWLFFWSVNACVLVAIYGGQGLLFNTHLYFLLNALVIVVLIPPGEFRVGLAMVSISLMLFIGHQAFPPQADPSLHSLSQLAIGAMSTTVYLTMTSGVMIALLFNEYVNRALEAHLIQQASTDSLTGLPNRRSFYQALTQTLSDPECGGQALSVAIVDIDHFKQVNDSYGHDVGDEVLKHVAAILREGSRSSEIVARLGGEEFGLILKVNAQPAQALAERLREAVTQTPFRSDALTVALSISLGVACMRVGQMQGAQLLKAADKALYAAKRNGRNRTEMACT